MADRSVVVRLRAEVQGFNQAMAQASKAAEQVGKGAEDAAKTADTAMGRMVQSAQNNRQAWNQAGGVLTGFGAATLGALGLATKAAMDWESAFAGVRKTVDASEAEFAALEAGLRGMARELPASHTEIAAVAEAAGQLGIATPNILTFTRTMIDLGEATNMSAEEAATSLARFMNVMGTSQSDVGRLGASVVGLGNNFATTESEIVAMAQRLSGAGAQAKLTEGDVMGIAAAMSSVGIEAEAGGSAMSQTMKRIGKAVDEGGERLDLFAQVSGMSAESFSAAWKNDPAMALDAFITGLSGVEAQGMTTNGVLADLGITGIRESDALLRLSAAAGQGAEGMSLMAEAVKMGNAEFELGTALIEEASQRYETAESRIAMAKNALVDSAISIGGVVLPAFADLADGVADTAGWFADLPAPVHQAAAGLGAVVGAGSLAAGSFLLLFPRIMDTVGAFKTLKTDMPGVAGALGRVGKAAGIAGLALAGIGIVDTFRRSFIEAGIGADEYTAALINLAETSDITRESFDKLYAETLPSSFEVVNDFGSALRELDADGFTKFADELSTGFGAFGNSVRDDLLATMEQVDRAMVSFAQGGALDQMVEQFNAATESAEAYGYSAQDVLNYLPGLRAELTNIATNAGLAADDQTLLKLATGELVPVVGDATSAMGEFADGMEGVEEATVSASEAVDNMLDSLSGIADAFLGARDAARKYEDATKDAQDAAKENGEHWEDGTKAARENAEAIDSMAGSLLDNAEKMNANGKASGEWLKGQREDLIAVAVEMGATREQAEEYVNQLGLTPENIQTLIELDTQAAKDEWNLLWEELGYNPPQVPVGADTTPAEGDVAEFSGLVGDMPPGAVPVTADTDPAQEEVTIWGSQVGDVPTTPVIVDADTFYAQEQLGMLQQAIYDSGGTVEINGETVKADDALAMLVQEINNGEGTVMINGTPVTAEAALLMLIQEINASGGTVEIDGDNVPAIFKTDQAKRHADSTTGTIDVDANTGGASAAIDRAARTRYSQIRVTWVQTNSAPSTRPGVRQMTFATGGPVYGPGTGTSDSIPALLSNGEHVITAREVAMAGGQDAIYRMREAIRSGFKFANGGAVERGSHGPVMSMVPVQRSQQVSASVDSGVLASAVSVAVRDGLSSATVVAQVSDRVAANLVRRGAAHNGRAGG